MNDQKSDINMSALQFDSSLCEAVDFARLDAHNSHDVSELIRKNLSAFEEAGTVLASTWRRLRDIEETYAGEGATYIVATLGENKQIIGGVGLLPFAGLSFDERKGMICDLFVESEFRGQNIGKKLFKQVIFAARQFGYESVYLETTPEMTQAQKLFRRFGFRPIELKEQNPGGEKSREIACYFLLENLTPH